MSEAGTAAVMHEIARDVGRPLTCQQRLILIALRTNPQGLTTRELVNTLGLRTTSTGTINRRLAYLLAKGLVVYTTPFKPGPAFSGRDYLTSLYFVGRE